MSGMYTHCLIKSYKDIETWFSKARSKTEGRPFKKWGRVIWYTNREFDRVSYCLKVYNIQVLSITPDNKLTFLIGPEEGRSISPTLSQGLCKFVPVNWGRAGKLQYRILPTEHLKEPWWLAQKTAPELYNGLQLDLTTGTFTNARPDMIKRIDSQARKVWLRALRNFKSDMKLRAKIGVFEGVSAGMNKVSGRMPNWQKPEWADLLYESILSREYSMKFLMGIVQTLPMVSWTPTGRLHPLNMREHVAYAVNYIINVNRVDLRTRFGVFSDEVESND